MTDPNSVLVVGASVAGIAAADGLRAEGVDGPITVVDADPNLPYDRPPLSKQALKDDWIPERGLLRPKNHYADNDIDLLLGQRAVALEPDRKALTLEGGDVLSAEHIVLSPGLRPRELTAPSVPSGVYPIRTAADSNAVREALRDEPRVVIVGGGFIGAETASVMAGMGLDVTLVEKRDLPFEQLFGSDVARSILRWHADAGVRLECGVGVASIQGFSHVEGLTLTDGRNLCADLVVLGLGADPAVDWLVNSGLELRNGISCDEFGRTSVPGVWACGDAASWWDPVMGTRTRVEHWTTAREHGVAVAYNIAHPHEPTCTAGPVRYFWSDQYGRRLQFLGTSAGHDSVHVVHGSLTDEEYVVLYGQMGELIGALGVKAARQLTRYRQLIASRAPLTDLLSTGATCVGVCP